jgi:hypothetical protein
VALSPTIPTSFVPKQPTQQAPRKYSSGNNIFLYVACAILAASIIAALGVFFYAQYLNSIESAKASELLTAQNNVNQNSVADFVRLHNRFIAADQILSQHVALSQFFALLGSITVQDVTFNSLGIEVAADRSAQITMLGQAANFNALASESTVFAQQKQITSAIFSGIQLNKDGTVSFDLAANLTPKLVIEASAPTVPELLPATAASTTTPVVAPAVSATAAVPTVTTTANAPSVSSTTP